MSICESCRRAAEISSKDVSELRESYDNASLMGISKFDGNFEDFMDRARSRSEELHNKCRGDTHCFCQHKVESIVRDTT